MTDNPRNIPANELDYQFMMIETTWGKEVTHELNELLTNKEIKKGEDPINESHLWGLLSYYSRDLRLANLSPWNGEIKYCEYMLNLAGDCLRSGYIRAFLTALSYVITVTELSQSKNGFFRRRLGTVTSEKFENTLEPKKKGLFGSKNKEEN